MISILIPSDGNILYLKRLLSSIKHNFINPVPIDFEIILTIKEEFINDDLLKYLTSLWFYGKIAIHKTKTQIPHCAAIKYAVGIAKYPLFAKIEEGTTFLSPDLLNRVCEFYQLLQPKEWLICPCLVGGYNQQSGSDRQIIYLEENDIYLDFSIVKEHTKEVFFVSTSYLKKWKFELANDDASYIRSCILILNIPVVQLKNGIVLELQDSLFGRQYRVK